MEDGAHVDDSSLNIQNDYFNNARKNRTRITVFLTNGQRITGLIRSFDKFTVILETRNGDQMVFKHAITSVAHALLNQQDGRGPRPPMRPGGHDRQDGRPHGAPGGRPQGPGHPAGPHPGGTPEGPRPGTDSRPRAISGPQGRSFGNYMDLSGVKVAPGSAPPSPGPSEPAPAEGAGPAAAGPAPTPESAPEAPPSAAPATGDSAAEEPTPGAQGS